MIDGAAIRAAAARLAGVAIRTPLIESAELNRRTGGRVFLKAESLQRTGSFKIRGAYNRMAQLSPAQRTSGVVAWSSGNHAQGVAAAGALLGIATTVVMPADAPHAKLQNTRRLGAEVVTYERLRGDREQIARDIAAECGAALVPSYDHDQIIAGQGTVGLEIAAALRDLSERPDRVVIPCGGGGLSAGSGIAIHEAFPDASILAVEPRDFDDTARSLASGRRESVSVAGESICDALQTPTPGELTFAINSRHLTGVETVSDDEVHRAMRFAFQHHKLVLEPGGAVGLAAMLTGRLDAAAKTTVVVLSGGNVDRDDFFRIQAEKD